MNKSLFLSKQLNVLAIIVLMACANSVSAQWYIGGRASFDANSRNSEDGESQYIDDSKSSYLTFNPSVGYFLTENFLVGLGINYRFSTNEQEFGNNGSYNWESKTHSVTFEPHIRHYFSLTEKIKLTNHAGIFMGKLNSASVMEVDGADAKHKSDKNSTLLGILYRPGLSYNVTEKLILEANIGFVNYYFEKGDDISKIEYDDSNLNTEEKSTLNNNSFGISYNQISLGVSYKF